MNVHVICCHPVRTDAFFRFSFTRSLQQKVYFINHVDETDSFLKKISFAIKYFRFLSCVIDGAFHVESHN